MSDWRKDVIDNTFKRWGSYARPDLSETDTGKMLSISVALGAIFAESVEAEREWMQTPHSAFKTRPITMVLAGNLDDVLRQVEKERGL